MSWARFSASQCRIVELRFFGELNEEEIASTLNMLARTVRRDWRIAKAWLLREMDSEIRR